MVDAGTSKLGAIELTILELDSHRLIGTLHQKAG